MLSPLQIELAGDVKQGAGDGDQRVTASLLRPLCMREPEPQTWFSKGQANLLSEQNTLKQRQQV